MRHVWHGQESGREIARCRQGALFGIGIEELLMVGNSFRSDIEPVLRLGGNAIHIPFAVEWAHEMTEEFDHDNLLRIQSISQLPEILGRPLSH